MTGAVPHGPAEEHRTIAGAFTDRVRAVPAHAWDNPAPVEGWVARDVVRHLVDWLPAFLDDSAGITLPAGPPVDDDPSGAWTVHCAAVQALLDDPETAGSTVRNPHIGDMRLDAAISMIYTADVFMHTWDLSRATGQNETLDAARCAEMLAGMETMEEAIRSSGQYGPRVPVPDEADAQTKLLGFIGRRP